MCVMGVLWAGVRVADAREANVTYSRVDVTTDTSHENYYRVHLPLVRVGFRVAHWLK